MRQPQISGRVIRATPGPEADEALRLFWDTVWQLAEEQQAKRLAEAEREKGEAGSKAG